VCLVTVASCSNDSSPVELQPPSNASALFLVRTLIDRDEPMMISAIVLNVCRIVASDLVLGTLPNFFQEEKFRQATTQITCKRFINVNVTFVVQLI